ncbi:hypothetical protein BDV12DRAFT_174470 [Aspergillus spectabilis]
MNEPPRSIDPTSTEDYALVIPPLQETLHVVIAVALYNTMELFFLIFIFFKSQHGRYCWSVHPSAMRYTQSFLPAPNSTKSPLLSAI